MRAQKPLKAEISDIVELNTTVNGITNYNLPVRLFVQSDTAVILDLWVTTPKQVASLFW